MPAAPKAYRGTKGRRGGYGGFSAFDLPQPQDPIQPGSTEMGAQWPGLDCLSAVQASSVLDGLLMLRWLCCVLVLCLEAFAETFAQLLCRTIPLPPAFVAGDNGRRYLAYNSLGAITLRQEEDHNVVEVRARALSVWLIMLVCWAACLMLRMLRQEQGDIVVEARAQLLPLQCGAAVVERRVRAAASLVLCSSALPCTRQQRSSHAVCKHLPASRRACETTSCHPSAQPPGALHSSVYSALSR